MRCVVVLALLGALGMAQTVPGQGFDALHARAEALRAAASPEAASSDIAAAYAQALAAFDALGAADPSRAASVGRAAQSALLAGDPGRALGLAEEGARVDAADALPTEIRLRALVELRQADAFVAALPGAAVAHAGAVERACAAVVASHGGALCEAADRALRQGRHAEGLLVFEALAQATGRASIALGNWALGLRQVGRVEASEKLYAEALAASPNDAELWNDYGLLLKGEHRDREAMTAFAKSLALDATTPATGPAVSNLAFMQARGRGRDAGADGLRDPVAALSAVVARRPDAMMARRLLLDALVEPARFQAPQPDRDGVGR